MTSKKGNPHNTVGFLVLLNKMLLFSDKQCTETTETTSFFANPNPPDTNPTLSEPYPQTLDEHPGSSFPWLSACQRNK